MKTNHPRLAWAWLAALALLTVAVKSQSLAALDQRITYHLQAIRTPHADTPARAVTFFGSSPWTLAVGVVMAGWWWLRRERTTLALFIGAGCAGALLELCLRLVVQQWRPDAVSVPTVMDLRTRFELAGFPSGHAFRAAFLYGWWARTLARRRTRWAMVGTLGCGLLALLIGLTRVYLNRHWPTDVIGGWLVAMTVLSFAAEQQRHRGNP